MPRKWPIALLLAAVIFSVTYVPRAWRYWQLLNLQDACLKADLPKDEPLYDDGIVTARELTASGRAAWGAWPANALTKTVVVDARWTRLASELGVTPRQTGGSLPTTFLHERFTPDGRRRLVVVESFDRVTVVVPATWPSGAPRIAWRGYAIWNTTSERILRIPLSGAEQLRAGIPDPTDQARFTLPVVWGGVHATLEYRLGNDDVVTMRLLDPAGFEARLKLAMENDQRARNAKPPLPPF